MLPAADVFRALGDPTRRALFERLTRKTESSVKDLVACFDVSQPAISQHLDALREAGLVTRRKVGRSSHWRVEPKGMRPLVRWVDHYRRFWEKQLPRLARLLEEMP